MADLFADELRHGGCSTIERDAFNHSGLAMATPSPARTKRAAEAKSLVRRATIAALMIADTRRKRAFVTGISGQDGSYLAEGWTPKTSFEELVNLMVDADLILAAGEAKLQA